MGEVGYPGRVSAEWFAEVYREDPDPWNFATSAYEQRKYDVTLASLPRPTYASAFEPGCSNGVLTSRLTARCGRILATDVVADVVARARERLAPWPYVEVQRRAVPDEWPTGKFDLIVVSELGYYFPIPELDDILRRATGSLVPGGDLVAVHWRGITDYPLTSEEVHRRIDGRSELRQLVCHVEPEFELGCWRRA